MTATENPIAKTFIVCGVVIQKDGKYLLVQEKQPKAYKLWNLPAGRVDEGETLEQAAVREAEEECGLKVELGEHLLTLHKTVETPVLHSFRAKSFTGEVKYPEDEILDAQWFTLEEIESMKDKLRNQEYILGSIRLA